MFGRSYKADVNIRCDLNAPGHQALIEKGKTYYIVNSGKAQGKYHSRHCYEAALAHYEYLEKELKNGKS